MYKELLEYIIKNGIKFIRPMMVIVVILLLGKTILEMI